LSATLGSGINSVINKVMQKKPAQRKQSAATPRSLFLDPGALPLQSRLNRLFNYFAFGLKYCR
jgi:hypothetical protein